MDRTYLRISLDTAASGSIGKQRARLARQAVDPVEYVDESVSGSKVPFAERPGGGRLLSDLQKGDRVLVTRIDRAARNVRDLLDVVERVEAVGASIAFVDQSIDTAGPMGRFLLTVLGAIAELEAGIIAERRRESIAQFRVEGRHAVGRAPYGLRSVPNPNGRGLVLRPDPDEAPVIRDAVERILSGEPQHVLADEVGMGAPAFSRLLRNERLAGILGYNDDNSPHLDPDMAVFGLAEWRRLQDHLTRPDKAWTRAPGYGGALACETCGERLYLQRAANPAHTTYKCRRARHRTGQPFDGQPSGSVMAANADAFVEADFLARFGSTPLLETVTVSASAARDEAIAAARLRMESAKKAQDSAESDDEEEAAFRDYRAAKRALREAESLPDETVVEYRDTGANIADAWEGASDDQRTAMIAEHGRYIVAPGRLPLAEKIRFVPADEQADAACPTA